MNENNLPEQRLAFYEKLVKILIDVGEFDIDDVDAIDDMHGFASIIMEDLDIKAIEIKDGVAGFYLAPLFRGRPFSKKCLLHTTMYSISLSLSTMVSCPEKLLLPLT